MFEVEERQDIYIEKPKKYKVIMHNDNTTDFMFVIHVLESVFKKSTREAWELAMSIHTLGKGIAGIYTKDIAKTKLNKTMNMASEHGYSDFTLTLEEE